jgi:hypothetical protein
MATPPLSDAHVRAFGNQLVEVHIWLREQLARLRYDAATVLERPALWPGESVAGIELTEIAVMKLTTEWSDGRETEARALRFEYGERPRGRPGGRWLIITEGTSKVMSRFGSFADAGLRPGELRLTGLGGLDGEPDLWFGWLEHNGVYLGFESPQRDLVLAAARALRPIG